MATKRRLHRTISRAALLPVAFAATIAASSLALADDLIVYSPHAVERMTPLIDAFEAKNPDINVEHFRQPGEELVATIELEMRAGAPRADIVGLNEASLKYLQGKYEALDSYEPADWSQVREELRDPDKRIIPAFIDLYLIHYNENRVSEADKPASWVDLLDPKWKGQIVMADPASSQSVRSFIWYIANHMGEQDSANFGWPYFKKLGANEPHLESSHGTVRDLVISGERPVGVQLLSVASTAIKSGEPTGIVWPSEGSPGELSGFALVKGAANTEAAKKFLDFIVSKEAQEMMPVSLGGSSIRADITTPYPDGTPPTDVKIIPVDSVFISENRKESAEAFHRELGQ
jgi:iron(III) transport system substrate-binding protein